MVKVPQYQPDVALRPIFRQGIDVQATPDAAGAAIGKGMTALATGMGHMADSFARVQALEDTMRAKDADNKFADWDRNAKYGEGGFMTLEGRAAVEGREAYEKQLAEKRREFGQGLTPGAADKYEVASQARMRSSLESAIVHAASARKKWFADAGAARVETFANDALVNFNRPDLVSKNIAAGILEIREQAAMHGWDDATRKLREAEYASGVHKNVTLRIAQDDPLAAEKYMKDHAGQISGVHQFELNRSLETEIKNERSKREADAILQSGRAEPAASAPAGRTAGQSGPTAARARLYAALPGGKGKEHVDGLEQSFATNLSAMFQDAPPGIRDGLQVGSGYRSVERQRQLWENSDKTGKWVAPPGRSFHNHGQAVDIWYNGQRLDKAPAAVREWVHANARNYGLYFPMGHEPWHIEPQGTRGGSSSGTVAPRNNTVAPRVAFPSFDEIEARLSAISDPDVRDKTRQRVYAAIEVRNKADQANERAAKAELWRYIDQGATPDQVPMEVRQAAGMAAVSSAWNYMDTVARGRAVESDETLLYDMRRYAAASPTEFANIDLNDYRDRLSKDAIKELTGLQTSALIDQRKAREDGLNLTSAFSQATAQLEAVGITTTGKKGPTRDEASKRIAQFQNALASQMDEFKRANESRAPTQMEIQTMINRLLLPVVIKKPGMLWGTNSRDGFVFEAARRSDAETVDVAVKYENIPVDIRGAIAADLERKLGRKPSQREVEDRYEDFVLGRPTMENWSYD